jgi:hypothetical protein
MPADERGIQTHGGGRGIKSRRPVSSRGRRNGRTKNKAHGALPASAALGLGTGPKRRLGLKPGMASVAQNRGRRVLAPAEVEGLGFSGFKFGGRVVSGLMASITKGLVGAQSAGAPVIAFAGFNGNWIRGLLGNVRFGHEKFSW